jgi:hypothetical protein
MISFDNAPAIDLHPPRKSGDDDYDDGRRRSSPSKKHSRDSRKHDSKKHESEKQSSAKQSSDKPEKQDVKMESQQEMGEDPLEEFMANVHSEVAELKKADSIRAAVKKQRREEDNDEDDIGPTFGTGIRGPSEEELLAYEAFILIIKYFDHIYISNILSLLRPSFLCCFTVARSYVFHYL